MGINLYPAWISNYMSSKVLGEITYPFQNFNRSTVEVWKWISNFIPHFILDVITYQVSMLRLRFIHINERGPRLFLIHEANDNNHYHDCPNTLLNS